MKPLLFVAASLGIALSLEAQDNNKEDVARHLTELKHMLGPAYIERDAEVLERVYSDDYVVIDAHGNRRTKADDLAMLADSKRSYTFSKYDVSEVRVYGDTALLFGRGEVKGHGPTGPFHTSYVSTNVFVKMDGVWKAVAAHISASRTVE